MDLSDLQWLSLLAILACAAPAAALASDEPNPPAEAPTVAFECVATFYDHQGGSEVGKKTYDYGRLPADRDPVRTCLEQSAAVLLPGSMAFACECRPLDEAP